MRYLILLLLLSIPFSHAGKPPDTPQLLLANAFRQDINLAEYWVSEKYDGIRAYWNGRQLVSRNGHAFSAPSWFIAGFPDVALDGELWLGRGTFEQLSGIVRTGNAGNENWRNIHYMVFDAPAHHGTFNQRLAYLENLLGKNPPRFITLANQVKIGSHQELQEYLQEIVKAGGEGLILHKGDSFYKSGRSDDLLKLKPFDDAEAIVVKHIPGKGKYSNMTGSIQVSNAQGQYFRIGSGFRDAERLHPPAIGTTITYRFNGFTQKGLPRFPRFMRIRNDE